MNRLVEIIDKANRIGTKLKEYAYNLEFEDGDIRIAFFDRLGITLRSVDLLLINYYKAKEYDYLQSIGFNRDNMVNDDYYKLWIDDEFQFMDLLGHCSRILVIDTFSFFEFTIDTILAQILTLEEKESYRKKKSNEIRKILEVSNSDNLELILNKIDKKIPNHVPILNRLSALHKKLSNYSKENKAKTIELIEFLSTLRNTMHSNFIYKGENKAYNILGELNTFNNNETWKLLSSEKEGRMYAFDVLNYLINCVDYLAHRFSILLEHLDYDDKISNPVPDFKDIKLPEE